MDIEKVSIVQVNKESDYWHWVVAMPISQDVAMLDPELGQLYRISEGNEEFFVVGVNSYAIEFPGVNRRIQIG